jgi:hypothetical protein
MRLKEMRKRVMNMRRKKIMKKPAPGLTLVLKLSKLWMSLVLLLMNPN